MKARDYLAVSFMQIPFRKRPIATTAYVLSLVILIGAILIRATKQYGVLAFNPAFIAYDAVFFVLPAEIVYFVIVAGLTLLGKFTKKPLSQVFLFPAAPLFAVVAVILVALVQPYDHVDRLREEHRVRTHLALQEVREEPILGPDGKYTGIRLELTLLGKEAVGVDLSPPSIALSYGDHGGGGVRVFSVKDPPVKQATVLDAGETKTFVYELVPALPPYGLPYFQGEPTPLKISWTMTADFPGETLLFGPNRVRFTFTNKKIYRSRYSRYIEDSRLWTRPYAGDQFVEAPSCLAVADNICPVQCTQHNDADCCNMKEGSKYSVWFFEALDSPWRNGWCTTRPRSEGE